jgi:hypothetical protein
MLPLLLEFLLLSPVWQVLEAIEDSCEKEDEGDLRHDHTFPCVNVKNRQGRLYLNQRGPFVEYWLLLDLESEPVIQIYSARKKRNE